MNSSAKSLLNKFATVRRRTVLTVAFLATVGAFLPASASQAAAPGADVVLVDLSVVRAAVGTPYSYVYEVDNRGPDAATDVGLTAVLTGISSFESVSSDRGTCTYVPASATAECDIGRLASRGSATIEIVVTPTDGTGSAATASSTAGQDTDSSNNDAVSSPHLVAAGAADLWVYPNSGVDDTGLGSTGYAIPGESFDYSIDVVNDGPAIAEDVVLSVLLPYGVELQDSSVPCTVHADDGANALVSCALGDVETGQTVALTALAPIGAAGRTLRTEVAVEGSGPDPGPQPNTSSNYLVVAPGLAASDGATSEGGSALEIPVQLYGSVDHAVSVDYATADGTALASTDYTATTGTLTFAPGQTTKSVSVPLLSDQITEPNESLTLTLANVDEGAATGPPVTLVNAVAAGTIVDNDPKVSIGDARVKEGDKGTRKAALLVRLSHASPDLVSVHFATSSGSAAARSDFKPVKRTVAFLPGQRKLVVTVLVVGDLRNEQSERFFANLSKITGALRADAKGAVKIVDDD